MIGETEMKSFEAVDLSLIGVRYHSATKQPMGIFVVSF